MWWRRDPRIDELIARFDAFEKADKEWKHKHENNHHGRMSQIKDKIPWTAIILVLAGIMNYLVNGTTP